MTSKADKLPLETEPVSRDNNTILTLKPGDQTLSRLTQLIIVVSNHLASNLEPLFPNIPLKHCTTRFISQISTKFNYTNNVTFLNTNDRAVPTYK